MFFRPSYLSHLLSKPFFLNSAVSSEWNVSFFALHRHADQSAKQWIIMFLDVDSSGSRSSVVKIRLVGPSFLHIRKIEIDGAEHDLLHTLLQR
jgi:hypothetical protein